MSSLDFSRFIRLTGLLLLILVLISSIQLSNSSILSSYELAILYNMPVITRSQSKTSSITLVEQEVSPFPSNDTSTDGEINFHTLFSTCSSPTDINYDYHDVTCRDPSTNDFISSASIESSPSLVSLAFQNSSPAKMDFTISNSPLHRQPEQGQFFENIPCSESLSVAHNCSISNSLKMEEDCEDSSRHISLNPSMDDVSKMFAALSAQLTSQSLQISSEISQVVQTNDTFKMEVRSEIDELRSLIQDMKTSSGQSMSSGHTTSSSPMSCSLPSVPPLVQSPIPSSPPGIPSIPQVSGGHRIDPQSQMLSLLAASFTKFS
jgi:hypothetical protein